MYIPKRKTDSLAPSDIAAVAVQRLHDCYQRISVSFARQALESEDTASQWASEALAEQYASAQHYVKQAINCLELAAQVAVKPTDFEKLTITHAAILNHGKATEMEIHNTCNNRADDISPKALRAGHLERK